MQVLSPWSPPAGTLGALVAAARTRAESLAPHAAKLAERASRAPEPRTTFAAALVHSDVGIVAEVKRRSPSKGSLNPEIAAPERGAAYAAGGARALSILTEPERFGGSIDDLVAARAALSVPLLRKDFIVSPLQVLESKGAGAAAILLIVRALAPADLRELAAVAADVGLEALFEVRDPRELDRALDAGARIVGVNNRNLETLEIDATTVERVLPLVPADRVAIAESGVRDRGDVERAAAAGANAVLVGSTLSTAADPSAAVRALTGVPAAGRGDARGH